MNRPAVEPGTGKSMSPGRRSRPRKGVRTTVRALVLVLSVITLLPVGLAAYWAVALPSSSALVALSSLLATGAIQAMTWLGLLAGIVALLRHRWFCRWACPTGLCADAATKCGLRLGRRSPRLPPVGQWIAVVTLAGACLGYPLLLWLDPLAMFSSVFGLGQARGVAAALGCVAGLAFVLLLSAAFPGVWCTRVCPLGAFQELLSHASALIRTRSGSAAPDPGAKPGFTLARRAFLGGVAGLLWAAGTGWARSATRGPLRPPGAMGEEQFTGLCIRCGNCARACPTEIIRPDLGGHGVAGLLTPKLDFSEEYCREDCTRCTEVCPSGALVPLAQSDKPRAGIGLPRVDMSLCLLGDDRECSVCRNRCPYEAIRLVFSEEEYTLTPVVEPDRCNGCGACEAACPTTPVKAIIIEPLVPGEPHE